jgi:hypothetical protein
MKIMKNNYIVLGVFCCVVLTMLFVMMLQKTSFTTVFDGILRRRVTVVTKKDDVYDIDRINQMTDPENTKDINAHELPVDVTEPPVDISNSGDLPEEYAPYHNE